MMEKRGWVIAGIAAAALLVLVVVWTILSNDSDTGGESATETTVAAVTTTTSSETSTTTTVPGSTTTVQVVGSSTTTIASAPTTVPATSPPGTLAPDPDPDTGQTEDDPVPYQTSVRLDRWQIGVSLANLDATQLVLDFVPFNDPPAEGSVYLLVELSGVNMGSETTQAVFDWKLQAPEFEHTPDGLECGVIPESIYDVGDIGPGGSFKANVCFEVPEEFIDEDLLLSLGLFDASGRERFFSLS